MERAALEQTIEVSAIARDFGVSEMTVRRDMQRLERDGFLRRTYGGATVHQVRSVEMGLTARILKQSAEKRAIAAAAANLIGSVRVMFVGMGTTAEQFARLIPSRDDLMVVTPSLTIASLLGTLKVKTIVVGGLVRQDELNCVGPLAVDAARRYNTEIAVIGAGGISVRRGITELDDSEAEVIMSALEHTDKVMVIADSSKFGASTLSTVAPISSIGIIVTHAGAPLDEVRAIEALGTKVVLADVPASAHETVERAG